MNKTNLLNASTAMVPRIYVYNKNLLNLLHITKPSENIFVLKHFWCDRLQYGLDFFKIFYGKFSKMPSICLDTIVSKKNK